MIAFIIPLLGEINNSSISTEFNYTNNSIGFINSVYDIPNAGFRFRSSFAEVAYTTDHTNIEVTWHTKAYTGVEVYINIFIDDIFFGTLVPVTGQQYSIVNLALPIGEKKILIRQGATAVYPLQGADITNIKLSGGVTAIPYIPLRKFNRMVTASDSIGVGAGTTNNGLKAWQVLLRQDLQDWEFASIGAAGAESSIVETLDDAQRVVSYLDGADFKVLWWSLGANDFANDPNVWKTNLENWLDTVHSLDNTINVYIQTMIYREGYETQLEILREKEREIVSTRSWCTLIEARDWIPLDQYYPDSLLVHPNNEGNITYAEKVKDVLLDISKLDSVFAVYKLSDGVDIKNGLNADIGSSVSFSLGVDGNAANFNNTTNSYISIPNNTQFNFNNGILDTSFSIKFNLKLLDTSSQWLISKRGAVSGQDEYQITYAGDKLEVTLYSTNNSSYISSSTISLSLNVFHCIVVTYNGSGLANGINVYVDGILATSVKSTVGSYVSMPLGSAPVYIGRAGWADGLRLNGSIDELYFFNEVINLEDISYLQSNYYPF